MSKKLEAIFKLIDEASVPGDRISRALQKIRDVAKKINGSELGDIVTKIGAGAKSAWPHVTKLGEALGKASAWAGGTALAGAGMFLAIGNAAVEASEFKRQALAGLRVLEGSDAAAAKTYHRLRAMADASGQSNDGIQGLYRQLTLVGFAAAEAEDAIAAGLDIKAISGDAGAGALFEAFKKIKATGKFGDLGDVMKGAGISEADLSQSLRAFDKFKRMTDKEISDAMAAGQVSADEGIKAIFDTISRVHNGGQMLGSSAKKLLGGSVSGQVQTFKNTLASLFEDVDTKPLVDAIANLSAALNSPTGKKAVEALNAAFASAGESLKAIATPENIAKLVTFLGDLLGVVLEVTKALGGGMLDGFMELMKPLIDVVKMSGASSSGLGGLADVFRTLGKVVGWIAAIFVYGFGAIAFIIYGLVEVVRAVVAFVSRHWEIFKAAFLSVLAVIAAPVYAFGALVVGVGYAIVKSALWWWSVVSGALKWLGSAFAAVGRAIVAAFQWWVDKVRKNWAAFGADLLSAWNWIVGAFNSAVAFVGSVLSTLWQFFVDVFNGIVTTISGWLDTVWTFITGGFSAIVGWFSDMWDTFVGIGKNIIDGIWSGISGAWDKLTGNTKKLFADLPAEVKKQLGIASPSKVFARIGVDAMAGFNVGFRNGADEPLSTMDQIAADVGGSMSDAPAGAGGTRGTVSLGGITIVVQAAQGMSEADARAVGHAAGAGFREQLADVWEELNLQLGAT